MKAAGSALSALICSAVLQISTLSCPSRRGELLVSGCDSQCCVTPGSWQRLHTDLTLDNCKGDQALYSGFSMSIRKEHCSGSREPDSSLSAPPLGSSLPGLSNGHGTSWSLSCCQCNNGILYEFQERRVATNASLDVDGAFSLVSFLSLPVSPVYFSRPSLFRA